MGNLTLLLSVKIMVVALGLCYTALCELYTLKHQEKVSYHSEGKDMEQASEKEAGRCKDPFASWWLHIHHLFSSVSPLVLPFITLETPVRFRDTSSFQRHQFVSETQRQQILLFFQILRVVEHFVIKGGALVFHPC